MAGGLWGLADGLVVEVSGRLLAAPLRVGLLLLSDLGLGLVLAVLMVAAGALMPARWGDWIGLRGRVWGGFVWGLTAMLCMDGAERWFTQPPPFTETPPLLGNPLVFVMGVAAVALVARMLALRLRPGRPRLALALGVVGVLAVRVELSRPNLGGLGSAASTAPHILLVSLDTTRADHFGVMGHATAQTPHFDALAAGGALFQNAMAPVPVTGPSHTTIMSGQGPWIHGALLNGIPVSADAPMLAEKLRASGWQTAAFVSAYVLEGHLGFNRGFAVYDDDFAWLQGFSGSLPGRIWAAVRRHSDPHHVLERKGGRTTDRALRWLAADEAGGPRFAWVHLFDPHGPYAPPPPWDTAYYEGDPRDPAHGSMEQVTGTAPYLRASLAGITDVDWVRAQYLGEVSYADAQIGRLVQAFEGLADDRPLLVVVVGDHGESLGEHNVWFNHGDDLFEPSLHVPLVLRMSGTIPRGARVSAPVELGDLAPTILELAGLSAPEATEGRSLVPQLFGAGGRAFARSIAFDRAANTAARAAGEITRPRWRMVSLRSPDHRFVWRESPEAVPVVYDRTVDPGETRSAGVPAEVLLELTRAAEGVAAAMSEDDVARSGAELDPATRARLEELGYLDQ